jgi:type II secretory ATPase GspE/PulE/Tfp pilus assembly ATPase PilB-like protein/nucleotide-binding universal stress UspA family protein
MKLPTQDVVIPMKPASTTILFPTDYSGMNEVALRQAIELARSSSARLLVLHVVPPDFPYVGVEPPPADQTKSVEGFHLSSVVESAGGGNGVQCEHRVLMGDPTAEILDVAKRESASLIVMSTTGQTGLRRFLMGGVAETVLRKAPCPVLTLSPGAEAVGPPSSAVVGTPPAPAPAKPATKEATPRALPPDVAYASNPALSLVARAVTARATDIHIDPFDSEYQVRWRVDGQLRNVCRLDQSVGRALVSQFKVIGNLDIADPFHGQEGRLHLPPSLAAYEARMTAMPVAGGEAVSLRLLDRDRLVRPLEELGLSSTSLGLVRQMLQLGAGLIITTGPSGSGKTTTVYSMLHALDDGTRNIVSIEDPVEYQIPSFRQISVDVRHDVTMTSGLRTLLRLDPDVVLLGEVRDPEAAEIAMRAASSGKYVFTTFHTRDVASLVTGFRDLGIDSRSLAGNLTGILSQRLVRRVCHECCRQEAPGDAERRLFTENGVENPKTVSRAVGCAHCQHTGYLDRIGVFEVVLPTGAIVDKIVHGVAENELRSAIREAGTPSLLTDVLTKVRDGITTLDEMGRMTWLDPS